jgi:hypothetical protein
LVVLDAGGVVIDHALGDPSHGVVAELEIPPLPSTSASYSTEHCEGAAPDAVLLR